MTRAQRLSIAAITILMLASTALAQNVEAEALFNQGDALMKEGKLAEACAALEASNRLETRAGTLIRLGDCRERMQLIASAWSAYKDALTRVKDPKKKVIAEAKVKELEPKLSSLKITVPDASRVQGLVISRNGQALEAPLWNMSVPIDGGTYTIAARAPGKQEWQTTVRIGVENDRKSIEVPILEPAKAVTASPQVTAPEPSEPSDDRVDSVSRWTTKRKIAVVLVGGAGVGLAAGIVLGMQSRSKEQQATDLCAQEDACPEADQANALIDAARGRAIGANIAFGVAGAAAIGAAVLWFTGAPKAESSIAIVPGPGSLAVIGRF